MSRAAYRLSFALVTNSPQRSNGGHFCESEVNERDESQIFVDTSMISREVQGFSEFGTHTNAIIRYLVDDPSYRLKFDLEA